MTPQQIVDSGLITKDELSEYKMFAFIREPKRRWLSAFFMGIGHFAQFGVETLEQMTRVIRNDDLWSRYFGTGEPTSKPFSGERYGFEDFLYKNYLFVDGEKVVETYRYENMAEILHALIADKTGVTSDVQLQHVQMHSRGVPEAFENPMSDWMPSDCLAKLETYLEQDRSFYDEARLSY